MTGRGSRAQFLGVVGPMLLVTLADGEAVQAEQVECERVAPVDKRDILPPGQHPRDSRKPNIDQVGHALERLQTFLTWIDEHRASFEKEREGDPETAEAELRNLQDSTEQAVLHLQRLTELLLAGHAIDAGKASPKGLCHPGWVHWVELILRKRRY